MRYNKIIVIFAIMSLTGCSKYDLRDTPLGVDVKDTGIESATDTKLKTGEITPYADTYDEKMRDTDVVKYNYIDKTVDLKNKDEIGYNYERKDNTYKIYPSTQHIKTNGTWKHFEYATTTAKTFYDIKFKPFSKLPFFVKAATADNVYADAHDGGCTYNSWTTWDSNRSATNCPNTATADIFVLAQRNTANSNNERVGYFFFDTSAISGTISTTSFNVYIPSDDSNSAETAYNWVGLYSSNSTKPATNFNQRGNTLYGSKYTAPFTATEYKTFYFNSAGLDYIKSTTTPKFSFRTGYNVANVKPDADGKYVRPQMRYAEYEGTDYDPYLSITVEAAPASNPCAPTAGATFYQTQDCYILTPTYHNALWNTNGHDLVIKNTEMRVQKLIVDNNDKVLVIGTGKLITK